MSMRLLDLEDRIITDTGSMVAKYDLLLRLALSGEPFAHLPFEAHPDIDLYHHFKGTKKTALQWREDEIIQGPAAETYAWITPEPYASLNIQELCEGSLEDLDLNTIIYQDRLDEELQRVRQREMEDFLRCLIWITDTLREKHTLWGLGRGSSCASLVLYLLGVNKVDPVKYDIPMEEFYK